MGQVVDTDRYPRSDPDGPTWRAVVARTRAALADLGCVLTRPAAHGGVFEYCPNIRSTESENLADVSAVLAGDGQHLVRRLTLRPGDLQLFRGRFALHRVATVRGDRARHTAIFAYSQRPGVIGSPERTRQLFGRVLPEHLATATVRGDTLLD